MRYAGYITNLAALPFWLLMALSISPTQAQQPTSAQTSAIRSNCRSDFMANCSGVTPGGKDALECLKTNLAKLSAGCKAAVSAISPPAVAAPPPAAVAKPAEPAAPAPPAPASAMAPAPMAPAAPVTPNRPVAAPMPKPVAKTAATAAAKPTAEQTNTIRSACRSDFMAHCSGITPGGAEALQCLQRNAPQLSASCRGAVAAVGGGGAAAAPAMAPPVQPAAPATNGFPALGPVRPMLPRRALIIKAICEADAHTLCAGVPPVGAAVLSCLAEHGPQLSPECYKALVPVTR